MKVSAKPSALGILCLLIAAVGMIGLAIMLRPIESKPPVVKTLQTAQRADAALGYPVTLPDGIQRSPAFDPRFIRQSAFERVTTPTAAVFTAPMGTESGGFSYIAQRFWDLNERRGGHHSGDDVNGIGGMNSDLGDPVFAIGDARVLFAGEGSPGWGKIVLLGHRGDAGRPLQSMYAHLDRVDVASGATLHRGQQVGTVGTGNNNYLAHLHFELRDAVTIDILRGYLAERGVHLDPAQIISSYAGQGGRVGPAAAAAVLEKVEADRREVPALKVAQ